MLQVESFEDLQKDVGIAIHKPFYCSLHPGESVKFFCIGCQVGFLLLTDIYLSSFYQCGSIASYESAGIARAKVSVCHALVLYQNKQS